MLSLARLYRFRVQSIGAALLLLLTLVASLPAGSVAAASTLHVTDCADSGSNTLRGLIASANAGDTIVYDLDCTTILASTLTIDKNLTIDGTGHDVILDGNNAMTVMVVPRGVTASVSDLTIQHGNGSGNLGIAGGISNQGMLTVTDVTLQNNTTGGDGGGIRNDGTLTVQRSAFLNNSAVSTGGGIVTDNSATVVNSTFSGNGAGAPGGAIDNLRGTLTVVNSTLANNSSSNGGGIANLIDSTLVLANDVIANSTGGNLFSVLPLDSMITGNNNLIDDSSISVLSGSNNRNQPALLGPLGDYGGPTQTIPLLPGSPAIDAGAPVGGNVPATDQRGNARNGAPDIGAYESQGFETVVSDTADGAANVANCENGLVGRCRLRDAIALVNSGSVGPNPTITFSLPNPSTITLDPTQGTLTLAANATISGPGANALAVDGAASVTVFTVNSDVIATISDLTIQHGHGSFFGGGISNQGSLTMTDVTLQNNTTGGPGGGIRNDGTLTVQRSAFLNNHADGSGGGGIFNFRESNATIVNSTFSGNGSQFDGGAISNGGRLTVVNSTLVDNSANIGGGIANYDLQAATTLTNVIIAGSAGGDLGRTETDSTIAGSHNLIDDGTISEIGVSDNIQADPLLGPLGDYGGPTQTFPILPGSPAIDAGDDAACTATGTGTVNNVDQRGISRSQGAHCDIGAFESRGFSLAAVSGSTPQAAATNTAFPNPLTVSVTANAPIEPVDGGGVSYTTPTSGASATLSAATAIIASGQASVTATANGTAGSYTVAASASGATPIAFNLTNLLADTTPPVTTASAVLASTNSAYGFGTWVNQPVAVTLSADDTTSASDDVESGVAHTYYTLDNGTQQTYASPITISTDGDHPLTFWSVDNESNSETPQTVHVMIDTTPPTITYSGNRGSYTVDQTVSIHCATGDALSGVATSTCTDVTGSAAGFGLGAHTVSATATDNAGNVGTGSVTFTVSVTVNSLCALTTRYTGNARTANQLCAPLQLVQLAERTHNQRMIGAAINSYILLLNMQRGRGLTAQEITTLTQLARAL